MDDDDFDWSLQKGETFSLNTGPAMDHTKYNENGTYMYIETSYPRQPGTATACTHPQTISGCG